MLTLNRKCQNVAKATTSGDTNRFATAAILVVILLLASSESFVNAQSFTDAGDSSRESSILIGVRDSDQPTNPQPTQSNFNVRPQEPIATGQVSQPGFEIPSSPTRDDFTNPVTDHGSSGFHSQVSDGSAAVGTFAHETKEPADVFAEPKPPSAPIRSFNATPIRVADSPEPDSSSQPDYASPPISQNGLRQVNATERLTGSANPGEPSTFRRQLNSSLSPQREPKSREPKALEPKALEPKADAMTASPRFVDTRPAPPAAMPGTSSDRFNPQFFPQDRPGMEPQSLRPAVRPSQSLRNSASRNPTSTIPVADSTSLQPATSIDHQVAPTSFAQSIGGNPPATKELAKMIVERYSIDNAPEPLPGEPMTLTEMLQQPIPMQNRRSMVSQYWETWFDWASVQNAIAHKEWLATIPNASAAGEKGLLDAARSAAENKVLAAKIQMGKSQAKLIRFMPTRRSGLSPLPSDLPLVERYETHYELYKARNMMPTRLLGIDQMLPQTLTLINNRAQTVQKAQAAIKQTMNAYSSRQSPLASVLEAARVWQSAEQELLASVTNYNQAIADYAFNITRQYTTPEQTVAMLIGNPKSNTAQQPSASRTASGTALSSNNRNNNRNSSTRSNRNNSRGGSDRTGNVSATSSFGQSATGSTASSSSDVAKSSNSSTLAANEKLAPTNRPAWNGGSTNRTRQANALGLGRPAAGRSTADARPSLGTTSRGSFGGASPRASSASSAVTSPVAFGSPATGINPQNTSNPSRSAAGNFGGRSNFGGRPNTNNAGGAASTSSGVGSSRSSSTLPGIPPAPKRGSFPLPKRPKTSSTFNGFGS